jgi:hypothetical protein
MLECLAKVGMVLAITMRGALLSDFLRLDDLGKSAGRAAATAREIGGNI